MHRGVLPSLDRCSRIPSPYRKPRRLPARPPLCSAHSPCCHGRVICLSIYCGPERHWGPEEAQETKRSMIWVDTYLEGAEERQVGLARGGGWVGGGGGGVKRQ